MKKYTNTKAQRAACDTLRDADIDQLKHLTNAEVWVLAQEQAAAAESEQAKVEALVARVAPTEASAVVEYGADEFTEALDAASMVPQGMSKFDTDELLDAAQVISQYINASGELLEEQSALRLAHAYYERSGRISQEKALDTTQQRFLDLAVDQEMRIKYPITMDIGTHPNPIAPQVIFVEMPRGSQAHLRGEKVWALAHIPVAQTYPDKVTGEVKVGPSKYVPECYTGVVRSFRSYEAGKAAQKELAQAVATFKKLRAKALAAAGDDRYSDDPVRTAGIDFSKLQTRQPSTSVL